MASETKTKDDKAMAASTTKPATPADGADDSRDDERSSTPGKTPAGAGGGGFFAIYKKGQGYWTRMGTAVGALLLGVLVTAELWRKLQGHFKVTNPANADKISLIASAAFALIYALFTWRLINKPRNVDFLIATDSEMKKVNWTSRRELIGSTKVVILFMFAIALFLFVLDFEFGQNFYYLRVLEIPPITYAVDVEHLTPNHVAATPIENPETHTVLVQAREHFSAAAIQSIRDMNVLLPSTKRVDKVNVVPEVSKWLIGHAIAIVVIAIPFVLRLMRRRDDDGGGGRGGRLSTRTR
jgi:preprotein translocase SecE subunit